MDEKLIAGYAAYTDAEEFGETVLEDTPGTVATVALSVASFVASASTYDIQC